MISIFPLAELGHADYGWLKTHYHFSFADYHNPARISFGHLRVINDDTIQPGKGFDTHAHRDMEIITYVTQGAITHRDSEGNEGRTEAGDVQIMSAGSGISHSEYNLESIETKLYQIWIKPRALNLPPRWQTHTFPTQQVTHHLHLLVSGDGSAPLAINQDAKVYTGNLIEGKPIQHSLQNNAYLLVMSGTLSINDMTMHQGDGAEITGMTNVSLTPKTNSKCLLIEL